MSRQCFHTWRRRYEAEGLDRLTAHGPGRPVWRVACTGEDRCALARLPRPR
ncbi:hypothetical protein LCH29_14095 [Streptomyces sp. BRA346]